MTARATVQVEPRSQTRIVTLDVLDLVERVQTGVEKRLFGVAQACNRTSSTADAVANSRVLSDEDGKEKEIGMETGGHAEQQER